MDDLNPLHPLYGIDVLVLGLGASGLAMARWCARHGARVRVWDSREDPPQAAALAGAVPGAVLFSRPLEVSSAHEVQRIFKSPGLSPHDPRLAVLFEAAAQAGTPVQGELDLFAQALADLREARDYAPKVIAITGTNGKTTTTALTGLLAERAGRRVAVAGNIGTPMLDRLTEALDSGEQSGLPEIWVLELSSFQLDGVDNFEPTAGALLNLSQDHLDWHGTMAHYAAAKARVFGREATMVIRRDDPALEALTAPMRAPVVVKPAARGQRATTASRRVVRFGADAPREPGDFGLVVDHGMAWLARAAEADPSLKPRKGEAPELHLQKLMPADALRIRGRHNAENALAALALATAAGCALAPMLHALREYRGEPHRVEPVGAVDGIEFFDDSKATNVGATLAALEGLGLERAPARLVVVLGGDGKGQDFAPLAAALRRHARAAATLGRDAAALEAVLAEAGVPFERQATLENATRWCLARAEPGDAVLLSPACASLDMFRDYTHRAQVFRDTVRSLAEERGGVL